MSLPTSHASGASKIWHTYYHIQSPQASSGDPPILPAPLLQMGSYTIFPYHFHVLLVSPTLLCHSFCDNNIMLLTLLNKSYNPTKHSLFKLGWETNVQISVAS